LNARSADEVLAFASARRDRARLTGTSSRERRITGADPDADIPF